MTRTVLVETTGKKDGSTGDREAMETPRGTIASLRAEFPHVNAARSTVMAVLIDGLTTIVGFGSLMIADHRGIFGLGYWVSWERSPRSPRR